MSAWAGPGGPLDFIVLTGFLGSGKTTLLRDFLALPDAADTAVIVNEVGEIGLDGAILTEGNDGLQMAMLANGCICCAVGSELATTVENLVAARDGALRRIVLETSGLSKPGPILRSLASLAALRLRISVVATFDCLRGGEMADLDEAAAQWAGAQALVLTKRDVATHAQLLAAHEMARAVNPLAEILDIDDRVACVQAAFTLRPGLPSAPPALIEAQHPRISVLLARPQGRLAWSDVATWLDNLAGLLGERLLRVKGLLAIEDSEEPVLVQSVGTLFSAPRQFTGAAAAPFLVIIARDLVLDELAEVGPDLPLRIAPLGARDPFTRRAMQPLRAG